MIIGYDPDKRTIQDEIQMTFGGYTVEEVRMHGRTAYLRLSQPGEEPRYVGVDASSVHDAAAIWPEL